MTRPRSTLWWYRRMRLVYRKYGVTDMVGRRQTWRDARRARSSMPISEQYKLLPIELRHRP